MSDGTSVHKASVKEARVQKASVERASTLQAARQVCSQPNLARHGKAFASEEPLRLLGPSVTPMVPFHCGAIGVRHRAAVASAFTVQSSEERYLIVACTVITDMPEAVGPCPVALMAKVSLPLYLAFALYSNVDRLSLLSLPCDGF